MRQSELFTTTTREAPKEEQSANAQLLLRAGFIDKLMAGVYSYLPLGFRVLKKIEGIIREEMNAVGGQEILMPALHPLENYETTKRENIDVLFYTELKGGKKLVLGQSHEEVVVPLAQRFIESYKDLPFAIYQIQTKFRNELRAKSGIFRGREFLMKDLYSFHATQDDLDSYYEKLKSTYHRIFERCGIGSETYLTFASGGSFSKYSHEFQTLTDAGEDTVYLCSKCRIAVNKEIRGETPSCPECGSKDADELRAIEVGNIFKLGSRFSDAFGVSYKDENGKPQPVVMGCYGIGLGRLMGTVVEKSHDANGIMWPASVAPFLVHLIALPGKGSDVVLKEAERVYTALQEEGIEVLFDDREGKRAGEKFADSDLIGIPWRMVVSEKTMEKGGVELKARTKKEGEILKLDSAIKLIQ